MNNPYAMLQSQAANDRVLVHSVDRYSGVTVPDTTLEAFQPDEADKFAALLQSSMDVWTQLKRRGLWIQVPLARSGFIAACAAEGFEFHHAQPKYVMMTCWLPQRTTTREHMAGLSAPQDGLKQQQPHGEAGAASASSSAVAASAPPPAVASEPSMIPDYATHSLGVGCMVLNSRGQCLVIQEKFAHPLLPDFWKLPGAC